MSYLIKQDVLKILSYKLLRKYKLHIMSVKAVNSSELTQKPSQTPIIPCTLRRASCYALASLP
jgi:hypothetical protein